MYCRSQSLTNEPRLVFQKSVDFVCGKQRDVKALVLAEINKKLLGDMY